jgi:hypothetical protein
MKTKRLICFDMDGTLNKFYDVPDWLSKLRAEDPSPYLNASPMWDMEALASVLRNLQSKGWEISVITWLSKDSSESYKTATRAAKLEWLKRYNFPFDSFHGVAYGATKADSVRRIAEYAILVDDNQKVRNGWSLGKTIDPTKVDLIEELRKVG